MSGAWMWLIVLIGAVCFWWGSRWGRARERVESHLAELRRSDARVQRRTERQEK